MDKRTRIYLVSPAAMSPGHNREYLHKIANELARNKSYKVILVTGGEYVPNALWGRPNYGLLKPLNIDLARIKTKNFSSYGRLALPIRGLLRLCLSLRFMKTLDKILKSVRRPVIVHMLGYEYISLWFSVLNWKSRPEIVLVLTAHLADFDRAFTSVRGIYKRLVRPMWRNCIKESGAVIAHGQEIKNRLINQLNLSAEDLRRFVVAQYPSDPKALILSRKEARAKLGIPEDAVVALFFGIIRPDKRLDVAVEACSLCEIPIWLLIAGSPQMVSVAKIGSWIRRVGIESHCTLILRYVEENEIPLFYSAANFFLATHDGSFCSQSGPVSLCRTYRLPAIAYEAGEIGRYVKQFGVGVTVKTFSSISFARAIKCLMEDEKRYQEIRSALATAAEYFSWENFCKNIEKAYHIALEEKTGNRL